MLFKNVSIAGLAHIDAPHTLTSKEINERLQPTLDRLGIRTDVLGDIAGIHARRLWDADMLHYAVIFFVIAIIAAVLGFSGIAGAASNVAWILFVVFLILAIISMFRKRG